MEATKRRVKRSRPRAQALRAYIGGNVDVAVIMALRERCNETGQYTAEAMEEALKDWLAKPAARGGKRREGK